MSRINPPKLQLQISRNSKAPFYASRRIHWNFNAAKVILRTVFLAREEKTPGDIHLSGGARSCGGGGGVVGKEAIALSTLKYSLDPAESQIKEEITEELEV